MLGLGVIWGAARGIEGLGGTRLLALWKSGGCYPRVTLRPLSPLATYTPFRDTTGNPGGPFSLSTKKSIEHLTRLDVLCCVQPFQERQWGAWTTEGRGGLWGGEQWPGDHSSEQGLTAGDWTFRFWGGDFIRWA